MAALWRVWRDDRSQRCMRLAACLFLFTTGCAYRWPSPPSGMLSDRILPSPEAASIDLQAFTSHKAESRLPPMETRNDPVEKPKSEKGPLSLEAAVSLGLSRSPQLARMRERAAAARAGKGVAFASFLPESRIFYRNIQGAPETSRFALPTIPTSVGNVAFGGSSDNFQLAELHVQWTIWDFGRTLGRYGQAAAESTSAELLYRRAQQTLTFNVTAAYFAALDAQARRIIAAESVRRASAHLQDARGFLKQGAYDRNDLFRAELQQAEMELLLINARTEEGIAIANLNRILGVNVSQPTVLIDQRRLPDVPVTLPLSLEMAVASREEIAAAEQAILSAQLGADIRKADYLPKVYVAGNASHLDGEGVRASELLSGGVSIELDLFTGGRKIASQQVANAEVRATIAQAKEICDTIAFEVFDAYLSLINARERIAVAKVAVEQATENLRVYNSRFRRGDATPTDIVDAELSMTRAQQSYVSALYDYQTGVARLSYAVGAEITGDLSDTRENPEPPLPEMIPIPTKPSPQEDSESFDFSPIQPTRELSEAEAPGVHSPRSKDSDTREAAMPSQLARSLPPAARIPKVQAGKLSITSIQPSDEPPVTVPIRPSTEIPERKGRP